MIVMTPPLVILFTLPLITNYLGVTASAVFQFLIQLVGVILLADFVSGFMHWLEDKLGEPDTPIIGKWIVQPNILHHHNPTAFVSKIGGRAVGILL